MTLVKFFSLLSVLVMLEVAAFQWRYGDLVYLSRDHERLQHSTTTTFQTNAERALARPTLTRSTLETIAQTAAVRKDEIVLLPALRRLAREYPSDVGANLRLAEALRAQGHADEATEFYKRAVEATAERPPQP